jgi:hypothetical protein
MWPSVFGRALRVADEPLAAAIAARPLQTEGRHPTTAPLGAGTSVATGPPPQGDRRKPAHPFESYWIRAFAGPDRAWWSERGTRALVGVPSRVRKHTGEYTEGLEEARRTARLCATTESLTVYKVPCRGLWLTYPVTRDRDPGTE